MGVTAAPQPAPALSKLPEAVVTKPRLDLARRQCDCGEAGGFSGRCGGCDRTGLTSGARESRHDAGVPAGMAHDLTRFQLWPQARPENAASGDAAEREAEAMGRRIARMPEPAARAALVYRGANGPGLAQAERPAALPAGVRDFMERRFGADFGAVRIYTGEAAAALSARASAQAFTYGQHIYFGRGRFQPDTIPGRELIAHELTHTIQQQAAPPLIQRKALDGAAPPAAAPDAAPADAHKYRMLDGRVVDLPEGVTAQDAAKLEAAAAAAKRRLAARLPPAPVPPVHKPPEKPVAKKPPAAVKKPIHTKQRTGGPRSAAIKAALKPIGGKLGHYLTGKAALVLTRGTAKLAALSRHEQTHDDAGQKTRQAELAVVIPVSDGQSRSNAAQVATVAAQPAPDTGGAKASRQLQQSLADAVPQTIDDVDHFKEDRKAQAAGAQVLQVVTADTGAVTDTFAEMKESPAPAPPEHDPVALPPPEAAPVTAAMNLGQNAVAPLLPEHTDVSQYTKDADAKLKQEGITQEQLDMVDSGDLAAANTQKKAMAKIANTQPAAARAFALDEAQKVDKDLQAQEHTERGALHQKRQAGLRHALDHQTKAKTALETKRDEVARKINGIFETAQTRVKAQLADLETASLKRFDDGNEKAARAFEDDVHRELEAYKDDRYSGWFGDLKRAKDWLLGLDDLPGVKEIFERNKARFERRITDLLAAITADAKRVVQDCEDTLRRARADIQTYRDTLEPGLKDIADKTAKEVGGKLDDLDGFVREKEAALAQKLADKQQAAIQAIDDKIEKMKEDISGALAKVGRLLLQAAKKFFSWTLEKFGYALSDIEAMIDKGVAVLKAIFTQPIQFVKNLVGAAILGFQNFGKNFLTHLKDSVFEWLTGSLDGISLPATWDIKGIAGVALQIIGLTWSNIRSKLVKATSETTVAAMEGGFELVVTLVRDGPMAAWEKLQEMADDIKAAFIEGVKDFIKIKIIEEAIKTIVALFVPGAGIIRAVIGIYDTVVFFIQKAKQIIDMVGNFLGSIGRIAAGDIAGAAQALENGLARGLTLVINFLAKFLRLDGVTAKIRDAIGKLRGKVDGMLDKVVAWIVEKGKGLFGKAKSAVGKLFGWEDSKADFADEEGEHHSLYVDESSGAPQLTIASTPIAAKQFLEVFLEQQGPAYRKANKDKIAAANAAIGAAAATVKEIDAIIKKSGKTDKALTPLLNTLLNKNVAASKALSALVGKNPLAEEARTHFLLEGVTGTYESIPKPTSDDLTADHQPQAAILQAAAKFDYFSDDGNMHERADKRASSGYAINLSTTRHKAGETYGAKGKGTKNEFLARVKDMVGGKPRTQQRQIVVGEIRKDLNRDVAAMQKIAGSEYKSDNWKDVLPGGKDKERQEVVKDIRGRILAGEDQIKSQDLDSLVN